MRETSPAETSSAYRYYVLAILIVVYALNFVDRQILAILAGPIKAEFGLSDGQFGMMSGLSFAIVYSTLAIPIAWLADRKSRVWIMTGALTVWSGFTALCGLAGGFWQLFAFRTGVGVGEAGGAAPGYSLISDYFPKHQRGRALAAFSFGIPIGTAAGILFGGLIAALIDWRLAFIIVGLAGVALAPIFLLTVREPRRGGMDLVEGAAMTEPPPAPPFGQVLRTLLVKPSFWLLAFGAACASVNGYGVALWLPSFFMRSLDMTLVETSWFYSGIALFGGVLGIWLGGLIADKLGARSRGAYPLVPAFAFLIAMPLSFAAMNSDSRLAVFFLFLVPTGLNLAWLGPVLASVQHLVPSTMRATASALFLLINNLVGIALGTWYFGAVSDVLKPHFGAESLRYAIYTGFGFYLLSVLLLLIASRTLKKDWVE